MSTAALETIPHPIAVRVTSGAGRCWVSGCTVIGVCMGLELPAVTASGGGAGCAVPAVLAKKDAKKAKKATKAAQKAARDVKTNTATAPVDRFGSFVRLCFSPAQSKGHRTCVGRPNPADPRCLINRMLWGAAARRRSWTGTPWALA